MFDFSLLISDLTSILFLCFLPVPSVQKVGSELNRERRAKEELEKEKKNEGSLFFPRQFFTGALLSERLEQATLSWLRKSSRAVNAGL